MHVLQKVTPPYLVHIYSIEDKTFRREKPNLSNLYIAAGSHFTDLYMLLYLPVKTEKPASICPNEQYDLINYL